MNRKNEFLKKLKKPLTAFLLSMAVTVLGLFTLSMLPVSATMGPTTTAPAVTTTAPVTTTVTTTPGTAVSSPDEGESSVDKTNPDSLLALLDPNDNNGTLDLILLITILSLAPSILIMMTSFTRIIIVFSLLRNAIGTQQTPPNQVLIGLALFLSMFIMMPTLKQVDEVAYKPYKAGEISTVEAVKAASVPLKEFMLKQASNESVQFFLDLSGEEMPKEDPQINLGLEVVVPAFIISELKLAFTIGFLLFIPFLIIDIVVSSVLMSMGMIMLPPAMISLPFKLLLFIMVDGWQLLAGALVNGFN